MKIKISIASKIIGFSALLLFLINFSQFYFVQTVFTAIIEEEEESQFNEKVNVVFQTLEQGERSLIGTIDALNYSDEISATKQFLRTATAIEGETALQQEKRYRELFQNDAVDRLERVYYRKEEEQLVPFIIDSAGITVMHPQLGRGSEALAGEPYIRRILEDSTGNFRYMDEEGEQWIVFRTFKSW